MKKLRLLTSASVPKLSHTSYTFLFLLWRIFAVCSASPSKLAQNNNNGERITGQRFAMEPQDQTAIVGSRVTLPCRVIEKQGMLQWTKDDFGLGTHRNLSGFDRYSMVGSDEEGDFSLDIYPVMLDDDAKYQCQVGPAPNGAPGIRSRFATLIVLVPPEPPKIVQGDYMVTTEGREIELECISHGGKPAAEITWIDGLGNVLTDGIEYMKEPLGDTRRFTAKSILKLTPKKEHHNTTFTCQAQNTADRTYRSAKLKLEVKYAPKVQVKVIGGALAGGRIPEGAEIRLSCRADANPGDLTYRWSINERPVVGDYTTEMIIHNVTRKYHGAVVKCEVHNAVGKSEASQMLDISYGPVFKTRPKSVEADVDQVAVLTCDVDGNPPADIVWIHEPTDRVVATTTNLTFAVTHENSGRYYCKASIMGFPEIGAEASVYLKGPPSIRSPRRQFGITGDNARLECIAFSVPKARHVIWTFNGREINTSNDHDYSILEDPLPEGIKSSLIVTESNSRHFGKYNCTVVNEYGNDTLEIELMAQKSVPLLMVVVGAVSLLAIVMMVIMIMVIYLKRGKRKLPPADVIPDHHISEKGYKESDRSSNISDLKIDRDHEYSETCSGTDSIATRLAMNILGSTGGSGAGSNQGGGGGVPLAGPVKIPSDYRYSGDYTDALGHLQLKSGQNNNGYVPYVDYSRDYSPPPSQLQRNYNTLSSTGTYVTGAVTSPPTSQSSQQLNGQLPGGNLSLTRNRQQELRQDNGLPSIQSSMNSLPNVLLGHQALLQNGLSLDPRFNATYGNPYLRNSNTSLPPPSTANPAATPAPPPYVKCPTSSNYSGLIGINTTSLNSGSIIGISSANHISQQQQQPSPQPSLTTQLTSPSSNSGQFILPTNGNIKKGSLATHV
ncbi:irregular chiasm C-roughest protein [Culicoides brevitarsis]|uniref:irregular chiasm C-roughest protein n=1 Tax=Culicoides brevitarsis TaxID=469753 RepID=UPI00307B11BD